MIYNIAIHNGPPYYYNWTWSSQYLTDSNSSPVDDSWTLMFTNSNTFSVTGNITGYIGDGHTYADFTCTYFVVGAACWNGSESGGVSITFNTSKPEHVLNRIRFYYPEIIDETDSNGGSISAVVVPTLNPLAMFNLPGDLPVDRNSGEVRYRKIFVKNENLFPVFDLKVWLKHNFNSGESIQIMNQYTEHSVQYSQGLSVYTLNSGEYATQTQAKLQHQWAGCGKLAAYFQSGQELGSYSEFWAPYLDPVILDGVMHIRFANEECIGAFSSGALGLGVIRQGLIIHDPLHPLTTFPYLSYSGQIGIPHFSWSGQVANIPIGSTQYPYQAGTIASVVVGMGDVLPNTSASFWLKWIVPPGTPPSSPDSGELHYSFDVITL